MSFKFKTISYDQETPESVVDDVVAEEDYFSEDSAYTGSKL